VGAVNKLLLGEGLQGVLGKEISSFNWSSCGESPAGSALSLVLDGGHGSLGGPVNLIRKAHSGGLLSSALSGGGVSGEANEILGSEFFWVHISEFVHFKVEGLSSSFKLGVVGLNIGKVLEPDGESVWLLLNRVSLVVLELPGIELVVFNAGVITIEGVEGDGSYCQDGQK
jgi:hypothetical protein